MFLCKNYLMMVDLKLFDLLYDLKLYEEIMSLIPFKVYHELIITNNWANLLSDGLVNGLVDLEQYTSLWGQYEIQYICMRIQKDSIIFFVMYFSWDDISFYGDVAFMIFLLYIVIASIKDRWSDN